MPTERITGRGEETLDRALAEADWVIAVAIPCFNEASTVARVIEDFRRVLPEASIHVFDNRSSDGTADVAERAGAQIHFVPERGKGEVVRTMFRELDADALLIVDGDGTYPADRARELLVPVLDGRAEMTVATRLEQHDPESFRALHVAGNRVVLRFINVLFGTQLTDAFSGYRAFSRRFFKTMPVLSRGFEIETEITLHALEHRKAIVEVPIAYGTRPAGSVSKLNTLRDGGVVIATLLRLYKDYRPLAFFGIPGGALLAAGIAAGGLSVAEFIEAGRVVGVARAVLAVACCVLGTVALATGFILDTLNRRARELYILVADHLVEGRRRAE
jgi:glycosyltransferase involved in cell wall biosynthesis